jgi:hypothetical protein
VKLWWLVDFSRLGQEKRAVEAIALGEPWFKLDRWCFYEGNLAALGTILVEGNPYPVRLLFPEVPAWVEPQEDVRWSSHQYGRGGTLCLELRPDNWVASSRGADVLRSAYNLLVAEHAAAKDPEGSRVPSAHNVGEVQSYDWGMHPVLIGAGCLDRVKAGTAQDLKALQWMAMDEVWPIMIHDAADRTSPRRPPSMDLDSWRFEIPVYVDAGPDAGRDPRRQARLPGRARARCRLDPADRGTRGRDLALHRRARADSIPPHRRGQTTSAQDFCSARPGGSTIGPHA